MKNVVQNNLNSPSSANGQYYSWLIGLGINYAFSSYAAQFALPRNAGNPVLSVRFRENGTWGGWSGITAEALTSGNKTISGNLEITNNANNN